MAKSAINGDKTARTSPCAPLGRATTLLLTLLLLATTNDSPLSAQLATQPAKADNTNSDNTNTDNSNTDNSNTDNSNTDNAASATYQDKTAAEWGELLKAEDDNARRRAAYALGRMGNNAAEQLDSLTLALDDDTAGVRRYVAEALGRIGPAAAKAVPEMAAKMLSIENTPVARGKRQDRPMQYVLARTLGNLAQSAKTAKPTLEKFIGHKDPVLRIEVAIALWKIDGDSRALAQLAELVESQANPGAMEALLALRGMNHDSAEVNKMVFVGLNSPVPDIRRAAVDVAVHMEPPLYPELIKALPNFTFGKLPVLVAIGKLNNKIRTQVLYSADVEDVKLLETLRLLIQQVVPLLIDQLNDEDANIREAAAFALSELGPIGLPSVLKQAINPDETMRGSIAQTLRWTESKLPSNWGQQPRMQQIRERLVNDFITACSGAQDDVKIDLFRLLDSFAYRNILLEPVFRRALQDTDPEVRQFATRGIARLPDSAPPTP